MVWWYCWVEEIPCPTTVWMYKNPTNHGINYQHPPGQERGPSFQKGKDSCLPVPPFQREQKKIAIFDREHIYNRPKNVDIMEKKQANGNSFYFDVLVPTFVIQIDPKNRPNNLGRHRFVAQRRVRSPERHFDTPAKGRCEDGVGFLFLGRVIFCWSFFELDNFWSDFEVGKIWRMVHIIYWIIDIFKMM